MTSILFDAFRGAMMNNPEGSRIEQKEAFLAEMRSDPEYIDILAADYFDRMAAVWIVKREARGFSFGRTDVAEDRSERTRAMLVSRAGTVAAVALLPPEERAAKKAEARKRAEAEITERRARLRRVVLLDLELPNGKKLRSATGAECARAGGFYAEVAKRLKPTQVVDRHFSEAELQAIQSHYYAKTTSA